MSPKYPQADIHTLTAQLDQLKKIRNSLQELTSLKDTFTAGATQDGLLAIRIERILIDEYAHLRMYYLFGKGDLSSAKYDDSRLKRLIQLHLYRIFAQVALLAGFPNPKAFVDFAKTSDVIQQVVLLLKSDVSCLENYPHIYENGALASVCESTVISNFAKKAIVDYAVEKANSFKTLAQTRG